MERNDRRRRADFIEDMVAAIAGGVWGSKVTKERVQNLRKRKG